MIGVHVKPSREFGHGGQGYLKFESRFMVSTRLSAQRKAISFYAVGIGMPKFSFLAYLALLKFSRPTQKNAKTVI